MQTTKTTSQIQEQKTSITTNVWLWSNFNAKLTNNDKIDDTALHVFINSFSPLMNNLNRFNNSKKLLFIRRIGKTNKWLGSEAIIKYKKFENIYGLQDFIYDKIFLIDCNSMQIKQEIKLNNFKLIPDDNTKFGRTSGFMAYTILLQLFPHAIITLVNFNRKNNGKYPNNCYQEWHNIDAEEQYFNNNNINRLIIG